MVCSEKFRGPLTGLTVIDFGHYYTGPMAGMLLADQGANVIRITRPGSGLKTRATDEGRGIH